MSALDVRSPFSRHDTEPSADGIAWAMLDLDDEEQAPRRLHAPLRLQRCGPCEARQFAEVVGDVECGTVLELGSY